MLAPSEKIACGCASAVDSTSPADPVSDRLGSIAARWLSSVRSAATNVCSA